MGDESDHAATARRPTGHGRFGQSVRKVRTAARALRQYGRDAPGYRGETQSTHALATRLDGALLARFPEMTRGVANAIKLVARRRCGLRYRTRRETTPVFWVPICGLRGLSGWRKTVASEPPAYRRLRYCGHGGGGCAWGSAAPVAVTVGRIPPSPRQYLTGRAFRVGRYRVAARIWCAHAAPVNPGTCHGSGQRRVWRDSPGRRYIRRTVRAGCMRRACAGSRIGTAALCRADYRAPGAAQFGTRNAGCGSQKFKFCLGWEHSHATKEGT